MYSESSAAQNRGNTFGPHRDGGRIPARCPERNAGWQAYGIARGTLHTRRAPTGVGCRWGSRATANDFYALLPAGACRQ